MAIIIIFLILAMTSCAEVRDIEEPCLPPNCVQFALPDIQPGESVAISLGIRSVPHTKEEAIAILQCDYPDVAHEREGPTYKEYVSYATYQREMLREMCLSWYLMQQPKNHGILQSHGAPNF